MATLEDVLAKIDRIICLLEMVALQDKRTVDYPKYDDTNPNVVFYPTIFDQPSTPIDVWAPPPPVTCKVDKNG